MNGLPGGTNAAVTLTGPVGSKTGNVTPGNMNSFLATSRLIWPILDIVADVRAPFTSSADTLVSDDSNGKWPTVLE